MTTKTIMDVVHSVRSKNAGPYTFTVDLFLNDRETFDEVVERGRITPQAVAEAYGISPDTVRVFPFAPALAIKVSIARELPGGGPGDSDVAGGQQFVPLLSLEP